MLFLHLHVLVLAFLTGRIGRRNRVTEWNSQVRHFHNHAPRHLFKMSEHHQARWHSAVNRLSKQIEFGAISAMPAALKTKSQASTARQNKTERLQECTDDGVWRKPGQNLETPDAESPDPRSDSGLGGTTSSSSDEDGECSVAPAVPIHLSPNDPATCPDRLHLSRTNSQSHLDHTRLVESLATFRETLVTNHVQTLSILDTELEKVKVGLAAAAATASFPLASKPASKSSCKDVRVKLPGALSSTSVGGTCKLQT